MRLPLSMRQGTSLVLPLLGSSLWLSCLCRGLESQGFLCNVLLGSVNPLANGVSPLAYFGRSPWMPEKSMATMATFKDGSLDVLTLASLPWRWAGPLSTGRIVIRSTLCFDHACQCSARASESAVCEPLDSQATPSWVGCAWCARARSPRRSRTSAGMRVMPRREKRRTAKLTPTCRSASNMGSGRFFTTRQATKVRRSATRKASGNLGDPGARRVP